METVVRQPGAAAPGWRARFARWHTALALGALAGLLLWRLARPDATAMPDWSAWLLIAGALIGVPHGSSDFIVAHRWLRPRFGWAWLPLFLVGYLLVVACVVAGWTVVPQSTLTVFLAVSALHFGAADNPDEPRNTAVFVARAITPILPIFMAHPHAVGPFVAALAGLPNERAVAGLIELRQFAFWPWALLVTYAAIRSAFRGGGTLSGLEGAIELAGLALAAILLPPFLTFGLYFCGLHAVRHMANLSAEFQPDSPKRALRLALAVVVPSALMCGVALALSWNLVAGAWATPVVVCIALKLLAALTVPHMALETLARSRGSVPV